MEKARQGNWGLKERQNNLWVRTVPDPQLKSVVYLHYLICKMGTVSSHKSGLSGREITLRRHLYNEYLCPLLSDPAETQHYVTCKYIHSLFAHSFVQHVFIGYVYVLLGLCAS